jgi:hypothetical protein
MSKGMPSAHGVEWKGRDTRESRKNWYENYDRIFGGKEESDGDDQSSKEAD